MRLKAAAHSLTRWMPRWTEQVVTSQSSCSQCQHTDAVTGKGRVKYVRAEMCSCHLLYPFHIEANVVQTAKVF